MKIIFFGAAILIVLIIVSIKSSIENREKNRQKLIKEFEGELEREIEYTDYENMKTYFYEMSKSWDNVIDDDTWNDLGMDDIFMKINNTNSSVGREYLYAMLRHPCTKPDEQKWLEDLINSFLNKPDERLKVQELFLELGYAKLIGVYRYIRNIVDFDTRSNRVHYLAQIFLVLSIFFALFARPDIGVIAFILAVAFTVITYYREKARIDAYLTCVKWIAQMICISKKLVSYKIDFLGDYSNKLNKLVASLKNIPKNIFLLVSASGMSGSLVEIALDYLRIFTHVDLIKFNGIVKEVKEKQDEILEMYELLGKIEASIAVCAFRNRTKIWCVPELKTESSLLIKDGYHLILSDPVANSIDASRCVLLTGSNASGKSTFLKTVAINAILAQTINTVAATKYVGECYRIVSSMSHRDDIINGDSYYMIEIKALKRILDMEKNSKQRILCFLDEVLRGTNTVERIAASSQILKSFGCGRTLCFAATHDIELTSLLKEWYDNYHFEESFENNDVKYNFILKTGPAVTRNAIKLLAQTGYDKNLIDNAVKMTEVFEQEGVWKITI